MPILAKGEAIESSSLDHRLDYWRVDDDGVVHVEEFAPEMIATIPPDERSIDPVAVLSLLGFNYICLDRTLIQGVQRLPAFSRLRSDGTIEPLALPPYDDCFVPPRQLAKRFVELFFDELCTYCSGYDRVYVLLSGGMDSRILVGALSRLKKQGRLDAEITTVTFGSPGCRDVVYAREVAEATGFDWRAVPLTSVHYRRNFELAARLAAGENLPYDIHRYDWFENVEPDSLVLMNIYGDGVGRRQYSSNHLTNIPSHRAGEPSALLNRNRIGQWRSQLQCDIDQLQARFFLPNETAGRELEMNIHYLRRMIVQACRLINRWATVRQVFSSRELVSYVWRHRIDHREDEFYEAILEITAPQLLDIPYAKTGALYRAPARDDGYEKRTSDYPRWGRRQLRSTIFSELTSGALDSLEIFDMDQVYWMYREWQREEEGADTFLGKQMVMLATLSRFVERYDVGPPRDEPPQPAGRAQWRALWERYVARSLQITRRVSRPIRVR